MKHYCGVTNVSVLYGFVAEFFYRDNGKANRYIKVVNRRKQANKGNQATK